MPLKNPYRTRITAGGDRLEYFGNVTTHTAGMESFKILVNSIISTPNAKCCTADISNMYLCSLLDKPEYVKFRVSLIPPAIIDHYKLRPLIHNGYIYAKIKKAWYGLKQSGKIAHDDLVRQLGEQISRLPNHRKWNKSHNLLVPASLVVCLIQISWR